MPKKWVIYALIAIGFAGLIGAHELTPAGSPDDADLVVPFILTVIGTLFSAMTVNLRLRELMLPMLVYPMMIPALMGAIQLSSLLVAGEPVGADNQIWFRLLVAFDVIFSLLALALVETVLVG